MTIEFNKIVGDGSKDAPITVATQETQSMSPKVKYIGIAIISLVCIGGCWFTLSLMDQQKNKKSVVAAQATADAELLAELKQLKKNQSEQAQSIKALSEQLQKQTPADAMKAIDARISDLETLTMQHAMALGQKSSATPVPTAAQVPSSVKSVPKKRTKHVDEASDDAPVVEKPSPKVNVNFTLESIDTINGASSIVIKKNGQRHFVNTGDTVDGLRIVNTDSQRQTVTVETATGARKTIEVAK